MVLAALFGLCAFSGRAAAPVEPFHFIPGVYHPGQQPNGNSVFLDAPEGLILVDTGRHPPHQQQLLDYARERGRPIVAIFNTHWHLDHSGGNATILAAYPRAEVYASHAVDGALAGFFPASRAQAEQYLASGQAGAQQAEEIRRDLDRIAHPEALRPTRPITATRRMRIGGRTLVVHLARFAATEGDVWIEDQRAGLVIAGDLVVASVPFMDTACVEGWRRALDEIAAVRVTTLIPGHGQPMTREQFLAWRSAFNNLADCGASDRAKADCVAGWRRDAAQFIPAGRERGVEAALSYYIDSRLRSSAEERQHYCHPLSAAQPPR